uniref:Uncharacterized protein n=1 Tax=Cucumis melo TaxID=3656 RepID=A0A9I9EHY3_CUCME
MEGSSAEDTEGPESWKAGELDEAVRQWNSILEIQRFIYRSLFILPIFRIHQIVNCATSRQSSPFPFVLMTSNELIEASVVKASYVQSLRRSHQHSYNTVVWHGPFVSMEYLPRHCSSLLKCFAHSSVNVVRFCRV